MALFMSVEAWKSIADWATIVFIAFTVVSGSAALILGDRINEKQTEQLLKFDRDLTDARTKLGEQQQRAAEAEKQLELVKKNQEPRGVPVDKLLSVLRAAPPGTAVMQFQDGIPEVALFAGNLHEWLVRAGWNIPKPTAVPSIVGNGGTALADIIISGRNLNDIENPNTSIGALWKAMVECGYKPGGVRDQTLPDSTLRILIGPRI
jgi:hypothetical protein